MLVVFAGLPGTGKTTLARLVADALDATFVRVDTIEVALHRAGIDPGAAGYAVGNAIARDQLTRERSVVVDAVNAVEVARAGWSDLAAEVGVPCRFVEVVCSDASEHRRRIESRSADLEGHTLPTWADVVDRQVDPWTVDRLVIDNLGEPAPQARRVLAWAATRT